MTAVRRQSGFQQGPDFGVVLTAALLASAIVWAVWAYEGAWWEKMLVAAGTALASALSAALLIEGKKSAGQPVVDEEVALEP